MYKKKKRIIFLIVILLIVSIGFLNRSRIKNYWTQRNLSENEIQVVEAADELINGVYVTSISENDAPYTFEYTGDVFLVENENRSIQRRVYNFEFLQDLRSAYRITGDGEYIETGMKYIRDFVEQADFNPEHMTWHDETTSGRLNNFYNFYQDGYDILSKDDREMLMEEMKFIAEIIAYTDFYSGSNNHGMYQDNAMLQYAIEFNDTEMIEIGSRRLANYFVSHFDKDGVHLENSPEYHYHMVESLKGILNRYNEEQLPSYETLEEIYVKSADYANMVVLPNGIIPNIGDSKNMEINLEKYYSPEIIEDSQASGRATYYESGYDIIKEEDTYLLFRAGYLQDYHHHNDDLSFWLYKDGNIFTEVGSYGYEAQIPYTDYAKTFNAHNTLIVNGENEAETKDVYLLDSNDPNIMSGETQRIIDTYFKRDIHFNESLTEFMITDFIESKNGGSQDYELLFHLDPNISIEVITGMNENVVELIRDNEKIGEFSTKHPISIIEDVYFPYYYAEPEETHVIVVEASGKQAIVESKITLY
jgi:hypothetical protein